MARRSALFACVALAVVLLGGNQAAEEKKDDNRTARQTIEDLIYDPYGLEEPTDVPLYYQARPRLGGYAPEARSYYRNPFRYAYYKGSYDYDEESQPQARLNGLGAAAISNILFNNRFSTSRPRPLAGLSNYIPVQWNPNFPNLATTFDSCTAPSGESGICAPGSVCSVFGGRPSGSCGLGGVCCINAVTTCGSTVTLNNTYWQTPTTVSSPSACGLTINLDTKLVEQKKPICQVRLDFISFSINQPTAGTCNIDYFQTTGSLNTAPQICGEAAGQHMYLNVPNSGTKTTNLQLLFNFGSGGSAGLTRSWNIKITMLPCGADYLAPADCLQYFTGTSGQVSTFNWKDDTSATRQLNGQVYNICFRTEQLSSGQTATQLCLSECTTTTSTAFSLTGTSVTAASQNAGAICNEDYLIIPGGFNPDPASTDKNDRFCGGTFNAVFAGASTTATTVCSKVKSFRISYFTDGTEVAVDKNLGFCLSYSQA